MDDYANGVLYGEKNKYYTYAQYGTAVAVIVWTLYCAIIAIIYGLEGSLEHFAMLFLMICSDAHLLLGFFFLKKSDQEEKKFLVNCIFIVFIVFLTGVVLNIYIWVAVATPCPVAPAGSTYCGLQTYFDPAYNQCISTNVTYYAPPTYYYPPPPGGNFTTGR